MSIRSGRHWHMRDLIVLGSALLLSLAVAFACPGAAAHGEDIATLRNVSSLLFGILAGFFVAFLLNRFTAIRSLLSRESSMLMELYRLSQPFGPEFAARTAELIDTYLIDRFDGDNYFSFTARGRDSLFGLFDNLDTLPPLTSQNLTSMHRNFVATLRETIALRRETIVTGTITVSLLQWLPLLLLATILVGSILALKSDTPLSSFLSGMLVFTIFTVLYLIKDLSDLNLGGEFLKFETMERVFDFLGQPRVLPPLPRPRRPGPTIDPALPAGYRQGPDLFDAHRGSIAGGGLAAGAGVKAAGPARTADASIPSPQGEVASRSDDGGASPLQ